MSGPAASPASPTAGRVLIIEDDQVIRTLEAIALRSRGWTVTEASSGRQGAALAASTDPDVIICDRRLPDVEGTEVIRALAANPSTAWIPVVLVTAMGEADDIVTGIDAGAHDYLVKPFKTIELEVRCRAALRVSREHRRLAESEGDYRRIVDLAAEGVCVVAPDRTISFANRRMAQLLGVGDGELVGRPITDFMDDEGRAASAERMERRRAGMAESGDFRFVRADGTSVWTSFNAAAMVDENGSFAGSIAMISDITERHRHEEALARSEARYRALLDHLPDTVAIVYDQNLEATVAVGQGLDARGVGGADVVGRPFDQLAAPDDVAFLEPLYRAALGGAATSTEFHSHLTGLDNLLDVVPILGREEEVAEFLVVARNVTQLKVRERALTIAEERWRAAFEQAPVAMAEVGTDGRFRRVNPALCRMLGYTAEHLLATTPVDLSHPEDAARARETVEAVVSGAVGYFRDEKRYLDAGGRVVWCTVSAVPIHGDDGQIDHLLVHYLDISELKQAADDLQQLAVHDPLTGLLNRRGFQEALSHHVGLAQRYGPEGALLVVDLDRLKAINDTGGHDAGDRAIVAAADALRRRMRSTDTVARLGGDEFAVILSRADRRQAARVAAALVRTIGHAAVSDLACPSLSASVGVAFFDDLRRTADDVLCAADRAMYGVKRAGGNGYVLEPQFQQDRPRYRRPA